MGLSLSVSRDWHQTELRLPNILSNKISYVSFLQEFKPRLALEPYGTAEEEAAKHSAPDVREPQEEPGPTSSLASLWHRAATQRGAPGLGCVSLMYLPGGGCSLTQWSPWGGQPILPPAHRWVQAACHGTAFLVCTLSALWKDRFPPLHCSQGLGSHPRQCWSIRCAASPPSSCPTVSPSSWVVSHGSTPVPSTGLIRFAKHFLQKAFIIIWSICFGTGICKTSINLSSEITSTIRSLGLTFISESLHVPLRIGRSSARSANEYFIKEMCQGCSVIASCFTALVLVIKAKHVFPPLTGTVEGCQ